MTYIAKREGKHVEIHDKAHDSYALKKILKCIRKVAEDQTVIAAHSHHGIPHKLDNHENFQFSVMRSNEVNKSDIEDNGLVPLQFVFKRKRWESHYKKGGAHKKRQTRFTLEEKKGIRENVEQAGYNIVKTYNDDQATPHFGVVTSEEAKYKHKESTLAPDDETDHPMILSAEEYEELRDRYVQRLNHYLDIL